MERENINLILEAVKAAEQDIGLVLQDESLRVLSVLAAASRPLRRADLATLSGFDPDAGNPFEYRLKKLMEAKMLVKESQNGATYYDLTDIGRKKVRGILGLLKYVAQNRLNEPKYVPHRERIVSICTTIDTIFNKLEEKGLVSATGNGEVRPSHELAVHKTNFKSIVRY